MKIVNAVWEKRNLGVKTCEVTIEQEDTLEEVNSACDDLSSRYECLVFKIPSNRSDLVLPMQSKNFQCIESAITTMTDLQNFNISDRYARFKKQISYQPMNEKDLSRLYEEIQSGIFKTDRIYLDPYFTHESAAQRYVFWVQDLVEQENIPYKVKFRNEDIGFLCILT